VLRAAGAVPGEGAHVSRRTRIKFCGLTRSEDVTRAAALGVDAIGLILVERSPRHIDLQQARALRAVLPPFVSAVLLTMDMPPAQVREHAQVMRPHWLQFHGGEEDPDCGAHGLPFLKALPMLGDEPVADAMARYPSAAGFVLDAHAAGQPGGSGQSFDWSRAPAGSTRPWLLAGGLHPDNVFDAILATRPYAVDVSSGIEHEPAIKCPLKMARFVAEVRRADAVLASTGSDSR
jgi:phosphoribosylanthranilate isomerase